MKTNLIPMLLCAALSSVQAQDFRALPPVEQPNAAELAYFGSKHPDFPAKNASDTGNVRLVRDFLTDLITGQFEAAHQRLAEGFVAYGPGYNDRLAANDLLQQWDRYSQLFADQQFTVETAVPAQVSDGDRQTAWVFVKGVWLGRDSRRRGLLIRVPFYTLARLTNGLIEQTHTSYGTDQLFYDFGFPLYSSGPASVVQRR